MSNSQLEKMAGLVRNIIDDAVRSLVAVGCPNDTACGLLIMQGAIRMRDREKIGEMRDFLDHFHDDFIEDDDEPN